MRQLFCTAAAVLALSGTAGATSVSWDIDADFNDRDGGLLVGQDIYLWGLVGTSSLTISDPRPKSKDLTFGSNTAHLMTLSWHNAETFIGRTEVGLDLDIDLTWNPPSGPTGMEFYRLGIENTDNSQPDPDSDDIVSFMQLSGLLDFGNILPLDLGDNVRVNGYSWVIDNGVGSFDAITGIWKNGEGDTSTLALKADIEVVPLPAAGWMLLAGVGGLVAVKRRKKVDA